VLKPLNKTGASKGIGRSIAVALAKEGAKIVINYISSTALANEVVNEIGPDSSIAIQADVSTIAGGKDLIAKTIQAFKRIDILVLNAGLMQQNGSLEATDEAMFDRLFATNVKGPFFMVKVCSKFTMLLN